MNVMLRGHARIHKQVNYSLGLLLPSPLRMQFLFGRTETKERQILKTTKNDARPVCSKCYWEDPRIPQDAPAAPELPRRGPCTGRRAALINVASPGAERGARRAAHAHSLPLSLGYKEKRNAVARGGSCILRRQMVLPPGRRRRRESGRARERRSPSHTAAGEEAR